MVLLKFDFVLLLSIFHVSHCERKIMDGEPVTADKSYVVYLVKGYLSEQRYDSWLCGGALVTPDFIITSAACVEDVQFMYAIAGYRKYVPDNEFENDDCTSKMKKKVVYTCVPITYQFDFDEIEKWAYIDIAIVKVESPYQFNNPDYQLMCSYAPSIIPINYELKRQADNIDAMVMGWGHTELWRSVNDKKNYNQEYLQFSATTIYNKKECKEAYKDYPNLLSTIDKYMICTWGPGHINDYGIPTYSSNQRSKKGARSGCITQKQKSLGLQGVLCKHETVDNSKQANIHTRKYLKSNESNNVTNKNGETNNMNETNSVNRTDNIDEPDHEKMNGYFNGSFTRRSGICQNDHGGPLVTWMGKKEVLIGVASVFKVTKDKKCIGPFLYTSTVCSGAFIGCVLGDRRANVLRGHNESVSTRKALLCDSPPNVKGFDMIESYVSWKDHPDGPADNEKQDGGGTQKKQKERYATIVKGNPDIDLIQKEKKPIDRFSSVIGPPPKRRPRFRKRPPKINPLRNRSPPKWDPRLNGSPGIKTPALKTPPPEMESPRNINTRPEMKPPAVFGIPPEIRPPAMFENPPEMKPPAVFGIPPEIRPPAMFEPPPEINPQPKIQSPPGINPQPEMKSPSNIGLPSEIESPQEVRSIPTEKPSSKMDDPKFDEILDFKSDDEILNVKPVMKSKVASYDTRVQSEILLRPQNPLNG